MESDFAGTYVYANNSPPCKIIILIILGKVYYYLKLAYKNDIFLVHA